LLDRGLNAWQALAVVAMLCTITGSAAALASCLNSEPLAWLTSSLMVVSMAQLRYFGHHEYKLLRRTTVYMWHASRSAVIQWLRLPQRRAAPHLETLSFDQAWQSLTMSMAQWPTQKLELRVRQNSDSVERHEWTRALPPSSGGYQWRLIMCFGPKADVRVEMVVSGVDADSNAPRYLSQIGSVLRTFGRYWLENPDRVESVGLRLFDPQVSGPDEPLRDAA
jgi:hypothetical protein